MRAAAARFVAQVGEFYEQEGYAPIMGRLFARLLLAPEPMTLSELVRDLGVSKASVSTDARRLARQGIVERVRLPNDRKAYYRVAGDLPASIMRLRIDRVRRFRALLQQTLPRPAGENPVVGSRLAELTRANSHMLDAMTRMLASWQAANPEGSARARQPRRPTEIASD